MKRKHPTSPSQSAPNAPRHRVRLPGFLINEDIGLGTIVKRVTSSIGIPPCGNCSRRAASLDNWITFSPNR